MPARRRENLAFYLFLIALCAGVSVLSLVLLAGERQRGALLAEYEAEQLASALMESFRDNEQVQLRNLGGRVLGFGVYTVSGQALHRLGTAPERIVEAPPEELRGQPLHRFQRGSRSLVLVRRLGVGPGMGPGMMGGGMGGMMRGPLGRRRPPAQLPSRRLADAPGFLFLELAAERFWGRERVFRLAQGLVPFALLGVAALVLLLYRRNDEYRRRLAAQGELARLGEISRTLSHEIKNPLSAIRIQTGILRKTLPEARTGELRIIEEEIQRLALLADRAGDFLRDPRGDPRSLDLAAFVGELALRYDRRVRFTCGGPLRVKVDEQRLRSVLENLINNALESGQGETGVEVECGAAKNRAELTVLDRGGGIPPAIRDQVFDPFFTSKTRGSGIGLAIARRFVAAAGGELTLEDRPGGGTAAKVTLPRETP